MINTMVAKGAKVHVYTGSVRPAIVIIGVIVVVHVVAAAVLANEINVQFWTFNITLFVLYALLFGVMVFQATRITITVYENGIDWQRGGSHVFTTWDNMDTIERKNEGDSATFGIYLHEPVQPEAHNWLDKRLFSTPVGYIRLIPTVTVPTTFNGLQGNVIDRQAFAETDFGQDLLRYAPHLLDR